MSDEARAACSNADAAPALSPPFCAASARQMNASALTRLAQGAGAEDAEEETEDGYDQ